MANQIDWGNVKPVGGAAPEIASITNLLGAIAENRQKQQMAAQQRAMQERHFAAQQANIAADNERANQQLQFQRDEAGARKAAATAKAEQERGADFREVLPKIQGALRNNDLQGARMLAEPHSGDVTENYDHKEAAAESQQERRQTADAWQPLMHTPMGSLMSPNLLPNPAPTPEEAASRYKIHSPVGRVLDYSPLDAQQAERRQSDEARARTEAAAGGLSLPHSTRIGPVAGALAALGAKPDEALKAGLGAGQFVEGQEGAMTRAAMAGSRPPKEPSKSTQEGRARDDARGDLTTYLSQTGYKLEQGSLRKFEHMKSLGAKAAAGNAVAARMFMGLVVKFAQGEVGVLTPSDMDIFWNQAGSPLDRTEEAFEKLITGGLGAEKQKKALAAIQTLQDTVSERLDKLYTGAVDLMQPYGDDGDRYLKSFFGKSPKSEAATKRKSPEDWVKEYAK